MEPLHWLLTIGSAAERPVKGRGASLSGLFLHISIRANKFSEHAIAWKATVRNQTKPL